MARRPSYKDVIAKIPVNYVGEGKLKTLQQNYELEDLALKLGMTFQNIKAVYNKGLFLLQAAVQAYQTIQQHKDYLPASNDLEDLLVQWEQDKGLLQYFAAIGINEYAILLKYNPTVLTYLKYKAKRTI